MLKATKGKDAMTMSKATKSKTAPDNDDLASTRCFVRHLLEEALEKHEDDVKVLRQLISQTDEASPFLVQKFASEAGWAVPFYGKGDGVFIRLDAFLAHHLDKEALRRRRLDASSLEYEAY